jgi:hypothetical protein
MTQVTSNTQPVMPKSRMAISIVSLVLGIGFLVPLILSIFAVVNSNKVATAYSCQQYEEANKASKNAKLLSIISLVWSTLAKISLSIFVLVYYFVIIGASLIFA